MSKVQSLPVGIIVMLLFGCASATRIGKTEAPSDIQVPVTIQSFPEQKPSWVGKSAVSWTEGDFVYFKSQSVEMPGMDTAEVDAELKLKIVLLNQISESVSRQAESGLSGGKGESVEGKIISDAIQSGASNVKIFGIARQESYSAQMAQMVSGQRKIYWNSFLLARVSKRDYQNMMARAFDSGVSEVQKAANVKAEDALKSARAKWDKAGQPPMLP